MIESNLFPGNQSIPKDLESMVYGKSVTDACVGWEETERMLEELAQAVLARRRVLGQGEK